MGRTGPYRATPVRTVHRGRISKQGSPWLRWIMCEAAQTAKRHPPAPLPTRSPPPGQEDRHHCDGPQAPHPRPTPRATSTNGTPHAAGPHLHTDRQRQSRTSGELPSPA
ncbi:transposase [Kitasatospora sp. NPDC048194]|uniref:transposase n=1 Tax=Kitasatospora sp. NPDC048194 TaxID=3364045 RepID=UPI003717720C